MDKQKQIEEIISLLIGKVVTGADSTKVLSLGYLTVREIAYMLADAGYCKIPENAVVLTDDEYERWQGQTLNIKKVRKETAEKFAFKVNTAINNHRKKVGENDYVVNAKRLIFEVNEICEEFTEGHE